MSQIAIPVLFTNRLIFAGKMTCYFIFKFDNCKSFSYFINAKEKQGSVVELCEKAKSWLQWIMCLYSNDSAYYNTVLMSSYSICDW